MKAAGRLALSGAALALVVSVVLTGCSQQQSTGGGISDEEQVALARWQHTLDQSLADSARADATAAGFSEGGGAIGAPTGRSDLLAACNGAAKLKFTATSTKSGRSAGSSTVACGAIGRIELNMSRANDLSFDVEPVKNGSMPGANDQTVVFWYVSVVSPDFK